MQVFETQRALKEYLNSIREDSTIGFVPTMGALHEGHLSLIRNSKQNNDITVCSIFVNPTQFNNPMDFEKYPSGYSRDITLLESVECDILFLPKKVEEVYQNEEITAINIGNLANVLEGEHRPGHFDGVIRVVKLLFEIIRPTKSYFGLKDYQQYLVIKKMVEQLQMNIEVVGCEIVREKNGLAMSSRNKRLSEIEKEDALSLQNALLMCREKFNKMSVSELEKDCLDILSKKSNPEYFKICDANTLQEIDNNNPSSEVRAFVAANIGEVRLIDNIEI